MATQAGWRFCGNCCGMFFNSAPDDNKGHCPATGHGHQAQGFVFYLPFDMPATTGQPGWRFCDKCFGMFFNGNPGEPPPPKDVCPTDKKPHHAQGFLFTLPSDATKGQPGWRFCDKCCGMFFAGNPGGPPTASHCPADEKPHEAQGILFALPHRAFPTPTMSIRLISDGGRFIEVKGSGFEPNQAARINFQVTFSEGGKQPPGAPRSVTIDSAGNLMDRIPLNSDISNAKVSAFDFGSGETVIATIN
jgi:hypothetical protein